MTQTRLEQGLYLFHLSRSARHVRAGERQEFVICAADEADAREWAACERGGEYSAVWLQPDESDCERIGVAMIGVEQGVIMSD